MSAPVTLTCPCGLTEEYLTAEQAYAAGWRLHKRAPLCPDCAAKRDTRPRAALVRKHGEAAVVRAEQIMRRH